MVERACRKCRYVTEENKCPLCNSEDLSEKWNNYVYIIDPEHSEIGRKMGVKAPGKYALNIK